MQNTLKYIAELRASQLGLALSFAILGLATTAARAQDAADEAELVLDQIQVTGSRITREGFITPSPVTAINSEEIRATGAESASDLLASLPALQNTFTSANSGRFIGTVGLGQLDLRGMGQARTLVLVNGRRHVGSSPGSSAVDVNTIPVELIERIEIITGGASAVYGADAVAGVVNFIMKRDFQGFEARAQHGAADEGSFERSFASFTGGNTFSDGRGSAAFSAEVSTQSSLGLTERSVGRQSLVLVPNPAFDPSRPVSESNPQRVLQGPGGLFTQTNGGRFVVGGTSYVFDADGSFRRQRFDGPRDTGQCVNCDYLDLAPTTELQPALDRFSLNSFFNFQINENHRAFFEGKYSRSNSESQRQPSFDQISADGSTGGLVVRLDNAYVSNELRQLHEQAGRQLIRVARFNEDAGRRGEEAERQTFRVVAGVDGYFGESWGYEVAAVHGRTTVDRINSANRINERFQAGLDAVRDSSGNLVCRTTIDPNAINPHTGSVYSAFARTGCVPFSIFGNGAVSAEAAQWFNARSLNEASLSQTVLGGSVNNPFLFDTWAGSAGFAGGVEYRREASSENTDPLSALGLTFLNAIPSRGGSYDVKEAFAELSLPVLADLPAVESLTFDFAGRFSHYDTIGSTGTWRLGLDWSVMPGLRVRGTRARSVRAPGINELFNPQSANFAVVADPCSARNIPNAANPTQRAANCRALGVPAGFEDAVSSGRPGFSGGNPDLNEEVGTTTSLGVVWQPEFVEGLGLSLDWWEIDLTDAIGAVTAQINANRCVDAPGGINNPFCAAIQRAGANGFVDSAGRAWAPYAIYSWTALSENLARSLREGVDIEADYRFEAFGGDANVRFLGTRLLKVRSYAFQDFPQEFVEALTTEGNPRWRANLSASYRHGPWRASWETRHVDGVLRVALESFQSNPGQVAPIRNGSAAYHDLQVGYRFEKGVEVYAGIDNAFDKQLPPARFGTGANDGLYDNVGRFFRVGAIVTF